MRLICPGCGMMASLEAWVADGDARLALGLLAQAPAEIMRYLPAYLGLFRQPGQALSWPKAQNLIRDLSRMAESGEVSTTAGKRRCPPAMWAQALEQMLSQRGSLNLPLTGHGYLVRIAWGLAEAAEAMAESRREESLRSGMGRQAVEQEDQEPPMAANGEMSEVRKKALAMRQDGDPAPVWEIIQKLLKEKEHDHHQS